MRKVLLAVGGLIVVAAIWWWPKESASGEKLSYQTQAVTRGAIESTVNTSGTLQALVTVEVGSELSGQIVELLADFNSQVEKGQVIAKLDDRTVKARLRSAEADIQMAEANISQQQAALTKAQAELHRSERAFVRVQELTRKKLANDAELDQAEAEREIAQAQIQVADAQLQSAQAQLAQRKAQQEQIALDLTRTLIRSPVSGTVISREVDVGQTVAASLSAPVLFTIAQDLSQMQIEADVDEADIGRIQEGQRVRFTVDSYPDRHFSGQVSQVRKSANVVSNVVTYKVIVDAPNGREALLPGMTANLDIVLGERSDVLRLPNAALRFRPKGETSDPAVARQGMPDIAAELKLTGQQAGEVTRLQQEMRDNLLKIREQMAGNPGPAGRQLFQQQRQSFQNKMKSVLSEQQFGEFQALLAKSRDRNPSATVWVLDGKGEPQARQVRTGLSNNDFTELLDGQLEENNAVIIRAERGQ